MKMVLKNNILFINDTENLTCPMMNPLILPSKLTQAKITVSRHPCLSTCAMFEDLGDSVILHCCDRHIFDVEHIGIPEKN